MSQNKLSTEDFNTNVPLHHEADYILQHIYDLSELVFFKFTTGVAVERIFEVS